LLRHCYRFWQVGNDVAGFGNNVKRNFVFSTKLQLIEHVQFVFGNKIECCFDKVERCFDIVAGVDGASQHL